MKVPVAQLPTNFPYLDLEISSGSGCNTHAKVILPGRQTRQFVDKYPTRSCRFAVITVRTQSSVKLFRVCKIQKSCFRYPRIVGSRFHSSVRQSGNGPRGRELLHSFGSCHFHLLIRSTFRIRRKRVHHFPSPVQYDVTKEKL